MPWCPYTDKDLFDDEISREHILPLALGGMNGFELPACKAFNATAGSAIDGAVANDFLIINRRNELDVRGHSGKRPAFVSKHSKDADTGRPLQLTIDRKEGLKFWCARSRRYIPGVPRVTFSLQFDLDLDLRCPPNFVFQGSMVIIET